MKKLVITLFALSLICALCACDQTVSNVCKHETTAHIEQESATCIAEGNIEYYHCAKCGKYFSDSDCKNEITLADTVLDIVDHISTKIDAKAATCTEQGNIEYYQCSVCKKYFSDSACKNEITLADTVLDYAAHTSTKIDAEASTCTKQGNIEYYQCSVCQKYFSDSACKNEITLADTVLDYAAHTPTKIDAKASTCTEQGNIEYYQCSVCQKYFSDSACTTEITAESTVTSLAVHNLEHNTETNSTCVVQGNIEYYYCSGCQKYYSDSEGKTEITEAQTKKALANHQASKVDAKPSTCTVKGNIDYYYCDICEKCFSDADATTEITKESTELTLADHTPDTTWSSDDNEHWKECTVCKEKLDKTCHTVECTTDTFTLQCKVCEKACGTYGKDSTKTVPEQSILVSGFEGTGYTVTKPDSTIFTVTESSTDNGASGSNYTKVYFEKNWDGGKATITFNKAYSLDCVESINFVVKNTSGVVYFHIGAKGNSYASTGGNAAWKTLSITVEDIRAGLVVGGTGTKNAYTGDLQTIVLEQNTKGTTVEIDSIYLVLDEDHTQKVEKTIPTGAVLACGFDGTGYTLSVPSGKTLTQQVKDSSTVGASGLKAQYIKFNNSWQNGAVTCTFTNAISLEGIQSVNFRVKITSGDLYIYFGTSNSYVYLKSTANAAYVDISIPVTELLAGNCYAGTTKIDSKTGTALASRSISSLFFASSTSSKEVIIDSMYLIPEAEE